MKIIHSLKRHHYVARLSVFLITAALIAGMVGCGDTLPPSQDLEIRDWYDLDAVRDNLTGNHTLMNDLNSTTLGYEELASPTANGGKGWEPIGNFWTDFWGTFDGQGHKIWDLFINRPDKENPVYRVGLFGAIGQAGVIKNVGLMNITVTGDTFVGGLAGENMGAMSSSYCIGSVIAGDAYVGGLVGLLAEGGTVSNSYSSTNVTGDMHIGGLVGFIYGDGTVNKSYSIGSVTGDSNVGGLVGSNKGTVNDSFWDTEASGQSTSAGGTGKNTTEMQDIDTFSGVAWDIVAVAHEETNPSYIWNIVDDVTYPFLSWQSVS